MIEKLKDFLFEPEEAPHSMRRSRQRRSSVERETEDNNENKWGYVLMVVFVPIALFIIGSGNRTSIEIPPLNPLSLCPVDKQYIADTTYILIDLSESLSRKQQNELQKSIEAASENLQKYDRLSISRMEPNLDNPRVHLRNLCNPADLESIKDTAGRSIDPKKDCPKIVKKEYLFHNRVGEAKRDHIRDICKNLDDFGKKIKDAIGDIPQTDPKQARSYIIGSIEDIMTDANEDDANRVPSATPTRLVIFSDMLQHADWFSQYRKQHGEWTMENIDQRRKTHAPDHMKTPPQNTFDEVLLCYQPNSHTILKRAKNKKDHRAMWKDYFKDSSSFSHEDLGGCPGAIANMMKK